MAVHVIQSIYTITYLTILEHKQDGGCSFVTYTFVTNKSQNCRSVLNCFVSFISLTTDYPG